jgi:hypothetical protein
MPTTAQIEVEKLSLDLKNFRTTQQKTEPNAIKAMISIKPERFFAVMESIIEDGYLPTENIILLKDGDKLIVKEGNRRIAALKLIHGKYKIAEYGIPKHIIEKVKLLGAVWKKDNLKVPCTTFNSLEADKVDRVVDLAHGKGEKASRDPWNSVARSRHNRDVKDGSEPALDILEKYLKVGQNLTGQQKERWGGEFPLTVLNEAIIKIYNRFGAINSVDLAKKYPKINFLTGFEEMIRDIGLEQLETRQIRNTDNGHDFAERYGIIVPTTVPNLTVPANTAGSSTTKPTGFVPVNPMATNPSQHTSNTTSATPTVTPSNPTPPALASNDPKHVANILKKFNPRGNNRQKVVVLRDELRKLKVNDNPIAFCLLLRSIFEISAKIYAQEKSIATTKSNGKEKTLAELLKTITDAITNNNSNTGMVRVLHGAITEISRQDGLLSITSMNQLVHHTTFSIVPKDICTLFGNIYPLLEIMN